MNNKLAQTRADIVIVGGGAGGVELAARLGRKLGRKAVLLIDHAPTHIWKPTLHEVAAGTMDGHREGLSYPILARRNGFSFALGELHSVDAQARQITLAEIHDDQGAVLVSQRQVGFETLVMALGSGSNFFGTPGAEYAYVLEQASDAEAFHRTLLIAFMRAANSADKQMSLAIVGGGATGVELSAELLEAHDEVLQSIAPDQQFALDIAIVEAAPRILSGLSERISEQATSVLLRRGIRVLTDTRVTEIYEGGLLTSSGDLPADLIVWAAGIKAASANKTYGLEVNRSNQFVVNDRLQTAASGVYALGDCASCVWHGDIKVPPRAQAAHQQAAYLAKLLMDKRAGRSTSAGFIYRDFGSLVSLGENRGVGNLMGALSGRNFFVDGLIAKWAYMSLHLMHHRAILGTGATALLAVARLLQRRISGRVKLH